ncbi:hypothetical protein NDU88_006704 [Pleurodeles waltl]|uniref:Uncharacterized protein n=1 Tax=Pleurodeles waltl TaxID=8319 RepID=A0AAV7VMN7_PLEWA|nr:hypothetical protein NDU88_006704 [Pleurodeles waltl]
MGPVNNGDGGVRGSRLMPVRADIPCWACRDGTADFFLNSANAWEELYEYRVELTTGGAPERQSLPRWHPRSTRWDQPTASSVWGHTKAQAEKDIWVFLLALTTLISEHL